MGSRWVRTVVVIVALATLGFAGNQIRLSTAALADEQGGERVFTDLGWTLKLTLAELRSAQQGYVADGQNREYWAARVETHLQAVLGSLDNLKRQVANPDTLAALDDAVAAVGDIRDLDEDARELIGSDQPLQALDLIFDQGFDLVERARAHVQAAQQEERTSRLDLMSTARANQSRMMWTAVAVIVLSMLLLAPAGASSDRDDSAPDDGEYHVPETNGLSLFSLDGDSGGDELDLPPVDSGDAAEAPAPPAAGAGRQEPVRPSAPEAAPDLAATAALCTDFSNLTNRDQLPGLLARTAALMNASGIIIWVSNGRALQPALGHGYASGTLERIGSIPQVGTNPTSNAFATRRIQIVESEGSDAGALAAPLMVSERCIGVLSAELREGWESSDAVQATASIVAAQLAPLLPADAPAVEPVSATGTHDKTGSATGTETVAPASS
ncbi:MAG: hypothetical protein OXG35_00940 [Acidobacteria bacterium]|nr:hypothetical protein [Acidobacteriota bacterium]